MSDQQRLEIGQTFGRYQIVRVLGEGGMGVVYEALHLGLKKRFAVKTLHPAIASMPEARLRFLREGEAASRIHHPHVVNVVDVGTEDGIPFLVMELLEGQSLETLIASGGRMDVASAVGLLLPAVSAVAAGHTQGVVHRDLKPANIFIARGAWGESVPKVLDFGVSKLMAASDGTGPTAAASLLGTAEYMSPEQAMGLKDVDGRSDQFALGQILYEMLTGARAHSGDNQLEVLHNIAIGNLRPPRQHRPDLPLALEEILLRMLALAPADRYPSLLQAGRALMPFAGDKVRTTLGSAFGAPAVETAVQAGPPPPGNRRRKIVFGVIAGIGIAGTVTLGLSRRSPSPRPAVDPVPPLALGVDAAAPKSALPPAAPAALPPRSVEMPVEIPLEAPTGAAKPSNHRGPARRAASRAGAGPARPHAPAPASTEPPGRGPNDALIIH